MVIAFASDDKNGLDGVLAYHFGRCPYFTFVKVEDGKVVSVRTQENPYAENHQAGVVPEWIKDNGADVIVAGGMGPRAQQMFSSLNIQPIVGAYGVIKDVLAQILKGRVQIAQVEHESNEHKEEGTEELRRLKLEVEQLRKIVSELTSKLNRLEEKLS